MTLLRAPKLPALMLSMFCALLLSACGGDGGGDADDYEAGLRKMQAHLDDANEASRASADSVDAGQRKVSLATAYRSLDKAAAAADALDPPDDARTAHNKLVAALRDYADLFKRLSELGENDPSESELYTEAGDIVKRMTAANASLEKAGYTASANEGS